MTGTPAMKRIAIAITAVLCLSAQTSRDAYRAAYREWREADPNLERDAGSLAANSAARAAAAAARAAKYSSTRADYLRGIAEPQQQMAALLARPMPEFPDFGRSARENVASEAAVVKRNLDTFQHDPDPGIQQLRTALEREYAALTGLTQALAQRDAAEESIKSASAALEKARAAALKPAQDVAAGTAADAAQADRETAAWADYYAHLGSPSGSSSTAPAASPTSATPAAPAPVAPRTSITPLPLVRYTGAWTFPSGGLFHGPEPEFVDLVVHEENGRASGTLFGRFKLPTGSKDDPVLRFDFSGDFRNTRNQSFTLETSDGAKGTIELIPGPAFNLLEVNFQTEPKPGKIRQANLVLVKK
jgi:hypothetical protein